MRLWSIHPKYLDATGLVAVWREALLAKAVLRGKTKGYKRHPQLTRFRESLNPIGAIDTYLEGILDEAKRRGYSFDGRKIGRARFGKRIAVSRSQMEYEFAHLKNKLVVRSPGSAAALKKTKKVMAHPLFRCVPGPVAEWERTRGR